MNRRERQRRRQRHRGHPLQRIALMGSMLVVAGIAIAALAAAGWGVAVAAPAPNLSEPKPREPGQLSQVFASDGTSLGYIPSDVLRTAVNANQVPDPLKKATVAIED